MPRPAATESRASCVRYSERYRQRSLRRIHPACGSAGLKSNSPVGWSSSSTPRLLITDPPDSGTDMTRASWTWGGCSLQEKSAHITVRRGGDVYHPDSVNVFGLQQLGIEPEW